MYGVMCNVNKKITADLSESNRLEKFTENLRKCGEIVTKTIVIPKLTQNNPRYTQI